MYIVKLYAKTKTKIKKKLNYAQQLKSKILNNLINVQGTSTNYKLMLSCYH